MRFYTLKNFIRSAPPTVKTVCENNVARGLYHGKQPFLYSRKIHTLHWYCLRSKKSQGETWPNCQILQISVA